MHNHDHDHSPIRTILICYKTCLETLDHCLSMGGKHAEASHIKLLMDCARICDTTADFVGRNSDYHKELSRICADICDACAESCEKLEGKEMEECAKACRKCGEACREMTG